MGYRDLGDHFRATGDLSEAQKNYLRTRDYCTTSEHVVEMCVNIIEVSLELQQYSLVQGYVSKAEGLLDSYNPAVASIAANKSAHSGIPATKGGSTSGADAIGALFQAGGSMRPSEPLTITTASSLLNSGSSGIPREVEVEGKKQVLAIRAKLYVASGLSFLSLKKYKEAAVQLLDIDTASSNAYSSVRSLPCVANKTDVPQRWLRVAMSLCTLSCVA